MAGELAALRMFNIQLKERIAETQKQVETERNRAEAAIDNLVQLATANQAAPVAQKAQERQTQEPVDLFEEDSKIIEKDIERLQGGSIDLFDLYEEVTSG